MSTGSAGDSRIGANSSSMHLFVTNLENLHQEWDSIIFLKPSLRLPPQAQTGVNGRKEPRRLILALTQPFIENLDGN
jgi:hypothetical protein